MLREILGLRIHERRSVREDHDRNLRPLLVAGGEVLLPLRRVGRVERMRHAVARELVPQRVAARRARVRDDGELTSSRCVLAPPLLEELRDQAMEQLVGRAERLQRVVVDVAERHRVADRARRLLVCPPAPRDEQRALRVRVQVVHPLEQLLALERSRASRGQHDRDGLAVLVQRLELRERSLGRRPADDAVVTLVALELARDPLERLCVFVHREDERELGHHSGTYAARRHSPSSPLNVCVPRSSKAQPGRPRQRSRQVGDEDLVGPAAAMILAAS